MEGAWRRAVRCGVVKLRRKRMDASVAEEAVDEGSSDEEGSECGEVMK